MSRNLSFLENVTELKRMSKKGIPCEGLDLEFKSSALLLPVEIYYCHFPKRSYLIFKTREEIRMRTVWDWGLKEQIQSHSYYPRLPKRPFLKLVSAAVVLGVKTKCARDLRDELGRTVVRNGCAASLGQFCCKTLNIRMIICANETLKVTDW